MELEGELTNRSNASPSCCIIFDHFHTTLDQYFPIIDQLATHHGAYYCFWEPNGTYNSWGGYAEYNYCSFSKKMWYRI